MSTVTVSEEALRQLVREALDNGHLGDLTVTEDDEPVNVNPVVDPSAAQTDPINPHFVPQTKPELDVAVKQLTKDVPIDKVPGAYKAIRAAIDAEQAKIEGEKEMKKVTQGGTEHIEEAVRRVVRKLIKQMNEAPADLPPVKKIPFGVHGDEYMRRFEKAKSNLSKTFRAGGTDDMPEPDEDTPESDADEPKKRRAYKATALGNMADVEGASFQEIAKELGFSVAGAKQAVDKALEKARWAASEIDLDSLEILVLQTMNDYIDTLNKSGELTPADVKLMKDHPDVVRELEGFREFLGNAIRRKRKEGQKLYDPIGESHLRKVAEAIELYSEAKEDELPRKEAVRALLDVMKRARLPRDYDGQHRAIATMLVDKAERFTNESPYKSRFRIVGNVLQVLVRHRPAAVIDLNEFDAYIRDNVVPATKVTQLKPKDPLKMTLQMAASGTPWQRVLKGFDWKPFMNAL